MERHISFISIFLLFSGGLAHAEEEPLGAIFDGLAGAGGARTDTLGSRNAAAMVLTSGMLSYSEAAWRSGFGYSTGIMEANPDTTTGAMLSVSKWSSNLPPSLSEIPGWSIDGEEVANNKDHSRYIGGFGLSMAQRRIAIGMTAIWDSVDGELSGEDSGLDLDLSAAGMLAEGLSVAVASRGILSGGLIDQSLVLSASWSADNVVRLDLDGVWQDDIMEGRIGLEAGMGQMGALRGGFSTSEVRQVIGTGISVYGQGTSIDYAYTYELSGDREGASTHCIGIRVSMGS
jgi:hypothetical protein